MEPSETTEHVRTRLRTLNAVMDWDAFRSLRGHTAKKTKRKRGYRDWLDNGREAVRYFTEKGRDNLDVMTWHGSHSEGD